MAISFPLASPAQFGYSAVQWGPMTNTARVKAPWTLQDVVQVFDGAMWQGTLQVLPQTGAEARGLAAWVTSLQGARGTFLLGDPGAPAPLGSAATAPGSPVVDGAGQTGAQLALRGLPANAAGYLLEGDYLQLGTAGEARLYMALAQVDADGAGKATVKIWPKLRTSPGDGAAVVVDGAEGVFALASPFTPWSERRGLIYDGVQLDVREVVT